MLIDKVISNPIEKVKGAQLKSAIPQINPDEGKGNMDRGSAQDEDLNREKIDNIVDTLNAAAKSVGKRVSFSYHEKTNRVIMKVRDTQTDQVIREIPPREMIRLLEHIHDMLGMFVDESR